MSVEKITFSVEMTTQPKAYYAVKLGIMVHEVEVEYDSDEELQQKCLDIQNKYQAILVDAKNVALKNEIYSSKVTEFNDEGVDVVVTVKGPDSSDDDFLESLDKENNLSDIVKGRPYERHNFQPKKEDMNFDIKEMDVDELEDVVIEKEEEETTGLFGDNNDDALDI